VGRRHLDLPEVVADDQVDVQPPSQALIEALCAIDIRDGSVTTSSPISIVESPAVSVKLALPTSVLLMLTSVGRLALAGACRCG
jgi:hypothetical protein